MRVVTVFLALVAVGLCWAEEPLRVSVRPSPLPPIGEYVDGTPALGRAEGDTCITGNATGTPTYYLSGGMAAGWGVAVLDTMQAMDACCGTPGVLPLNVWWAVVWQGGSGTISFVAHGALLSSTPGSGTPPDTCFARPSTQVCQGSQMRWQLSDPGSGFWYTWVYFPLNNCTFIPRQGYYFNAVIIDSSGANIYRLVDNVRRDCFDWRTTDNGTTWTELFGTSAWSLLMYSQFRCTQQVPIELSSLQAVASPTRVELRWRTESESENLGFNVYRSSGGPRAKVNQWLIPGAGTTLSPHDYAYVDGDVAPHQRLHYWVSDVSFAGAETFHGPVFVVVPGDVPQALSLAVESGERLTMKMGIPREGHVRLTVYDLSGREVVRLVDQALPAGWAQAEWDGEVGGTRAAAGPYVVRLVHEAGVASSKAVLR